MYGKSILVLLTVLLLSDCSHLSKNQVKRSSLGLKGGRSATASWSDSLSFKRISWYREWSLVFDLFYTRLRPDSPFYAWVSQEERALLNQCTEHYIVMTYHSRSGVISGANFLEGAERAGYQRVFLDGFDKQLRMHPGLMMLSLPLYNIYALCRSGSKDSKGLALDLPGFNRVEL